jgi:hypothetical protein
MGGQLETNPFFKRLLDAPINLRLIRLNRMKPETQINFIIKYPDQFVESYLLSSDDSKKLLKLNNISNKIRKSKSLKNQFYNGIKLITIGESQPENIKNNIDNYYSIKEFVDKYKQKFLLKQNLDDIKKEKAATFASTKQKGRKKQPLRRGLHISTDEFIKYATVHNYKTAIKKELINIAKLANINSPYKLKKAQLLEIIDDIVVNKLGAGKMKLSPTIKPDFPSGIDPQVFLETARGIAKLKGFDPKLLTLAPKGSKKKLIYNKIPFGQKQYFDFIQYLYLVNKGEINLDAAEKERDDYLKRSEKIKGTWREKLSPNLLAREILW